MENEEKTVEVQKNYSEEIVAEIEEGLKDRSIKINWNNFENGNVLWNHNGDIKYPVEINHENKTVRLM